MAKLMRPAASFYDSSEDCLYFVDSEVNLLCVSQLLFVTKIMIGHLANI